MKDFLPSHKIVGNGVVQVNAQDLLKQEKVKKAYEIAKQIVVNYPEKKRND